MKLSLIIYLCLAIFSGQLSFPQTDRSEFLKPSDTLNTVRKNTVIIAQSSTAAASLIALDRLWYADFPRSSFKTIDDSDEWLQMDKMGHVFSAYQLSRLGAESLNWSGASKKNQVLYGALLSTGFLTSIEIMDGFSAEWGFSWSDIAANSLGTGLFVGQELLWHEQRILLKYSFHRTSFAKQRPDKLGESFLEEVFKDYNGQTYWLSANIHSFFKTTKIPRWLNFAVGYGADGMLSGLSEGPIGLPEQNRQRQFYLSLDIDFSRIHTKSHFLRTVFSVINTLKIPFPTIEINPTKGVTVHLLYY